MLEKIWIDETMCIQPWEQFIEKLKEEWQEFVLFVCIPPLRFIPTFTRPDSYLIIGDSFVERKRCVSSHS